MLKPVVTSALLSNPKTIKVLWKRENGVENKQQRKKRRKKTDWRASACLQKSCRHCVSSSWEEESGWLLPMSDFVLMFPFTLFLVEPFCQSRNCAYLVYFHLGNMLRFQYWKESGIFRINIHGSRKVSACCWV